MKHKILILEDNTDFRNILIEFLSDNGIKALAAETIKEAMSIYNENGSDPSRLPDEIGETEINLFLVDLKLPDGNGMDFLKTVRKKSNHTPAIIMSSLITEDVRRTGNQLGVVAYFEKPFDLYELERVINLTLTLS